MIAIRYLWYYFFWLIVRLGLSFYFKKIKISGLGNIPKGRPVIFAANHENAFMDALLVTTRVGRFTHYLVRADVFKNPLASAILKSFNMLPVFRIRDGFGSLKANAKSFAQCIDALARGRSLLMFPEGKHDIRRVKRKLTKGISRIALGAINSEHGMKELYVVPVGLCYSDHKAFRSSVHVVFGDPIEVHGQQDAESQKTLRNQINDGLIHCTIALEEKSYKELDTLIFKSESGYDLSAPTQINTHAEKLAKCLKQTEGDGLNLAVDEFNESMESLGAKAWNPVKSMNRAKSLVVLITLLPFYLYGIAHNFIPIVISESIIALKVKDKIFTSSIKFALGLFLFPFCWLLEWQFFFPLQENPFYSVVYVMTLPASLLLVSHYHMELGKFWARRKLDKDSELRSNLEKSLSYLQRFKDKCH
ncbi:MAG: lysophospholipid acyltransferase family protein [Cyclobacteriaceae bacterium]